MQPATRSAGTCTDMTLMMVGMIQIVENVDRNTVNILDFQSLKQNLEESASGFFQHLNKRDDTFDFLAAAIADWKISSSFMS